MEQTTGTPARPQRPTGARREILEWVKSIAVVLALTFLVRTFLFTMIRVDGRSMQETLQNGDRVAATIIDLKLNGPQRGDIVILTYPGRTDLVIKRVIGVPGDTLQIVNGQTVINGEPYDEPYVAHASAQGYGPVTLDEDEFFVMGDNRSNSHDSRSQAVGPVSRDSILAKARLRVWPLNSVGGIT